MEALVHWHRLECYQTNSNKSQALCASSGTVFVAGTGPSTFLFYFQIFIFRFSCPLLFPGLTLFPSRSLAHACLFLFFFLRQHFCSVRAFNSRLLCAIIQVALARPDTNSRYASPLKKLQPSSRRFWTLDPPIKPIRIRTAPTLRSRESFNRHPAVLGIWTRP